MEDLFLFGIIYGINETEFIKSYICVFIVYFFKKMTIDATNI